MGAVTDAARHEASHTAAALLLGISVENTRINERGGGVTSLGPSSAEARVKAIAAAHEGAWPPSYPNRNGTDDDEDRLAAICKAAAITGPQWDALMDDTRALLDTATFTSLKGAITLLLRKHGAVSDDQLQRLLNATKPDTIDIVSVAAVPLEPQPEAQIKQAAYDTITAVLRAA